MPKFDLEELVKMALAIMFVIMMGILAAFFIGFLMIRILMETLFGY